MRVLIVEDEAKLAALLARGLIEESHVAEVAGRGEDALWMASASPNVIGYNVYRSTTSGGPYAKLNGSPVGATAYLDSNVASGQSYFYVATAVDSSNNESVYSTQATAIVPTP